jgi:transcriptional regulator with XRE-family HTH domain
MEQGYTPQNLRELLRENSMTQKALADLLGKDRRTVSRWLRDAADKSHHSMTHVDWLDVLGKLKLKGE